MHNQGFTLIELMAAVLIMAILAVIAVPMYQHYVAQAYQSKVQAEMLMLAERLENYRSRQLNYAGFQAQDETAAELGVIYLPKQSDAHNYHYKLQIVDINTQRTLQQSVIGQGWKIIATPNQTASAILRESPSYLLSSRQQQCASDALLAIDSEDCGEQTKTW